MLPGIRRRRRGRQRRPRPDGIGSRSYTSTSIDAAKSGFRAAARLPSWPGAVASSALRNLPGRVSCIWPRIHPSMPSPRGRLGPTWGSFPPRSAAAVVVQLSSRSALGHHLPASGPSPQAGRRQVNHRSLAQRRPQETLGVSCGRPSRATDGSVNGQRGPLTHSEMDRVESTRRGICEIPTISAGGRCAEATDNWAERIARLDDKPSGTARRSRRARVVRNRIVPCITPRHFYHPAVVVAELSCGCRDICRLGKRCQRNGVFDVGARGWLRSHVTYGNLANTFSQGRSSAVGSGLMRRDG